MCGWSALETATERPTRRCERSVGHFVNTVNTGYGIKVAGWPNIGSWLCLLLCRFLRFLRPPTTSRARRHAAPATVAPCHVYRAREDLQVLATPWSTPLPPWRAASASGVDGHPGEADGFTSWAQPPGNWHSS